MTEETPTEIMGNPLNRWSIVLHEATGSGPHASLALLLTTSPPLASRDPAESYRLGKAPEHAAYLLTPSTARRLAHDLLEFANALEVEGGKGDGS